MLIKAGKQHDWNDMESAGNDSPRSMEAVLDWRDPEPKLVQGPIAPVALEQGSAGNPLEGLVVETFRRKTSC